MRWEVVVCVVKVFVAGLSNSLAIIDIFRYFSDQMFLTTYFVFVSSYLPSFLPLITYFSPTFHLFFSYFSPFFPPIKSKLNGLLAPYELNSNIFTGEGPYQVECPPFLLIPKKCIPTVIKIS